MVIVKPTFLVIFILPLTAKITAYVSKIAKELFRQKINLEEIQRYLQEEQKKSPWYLCESDLSVTNIINHLKMVLRNEQYRHNR